MTDILITENCIRDDLDIETYHGQICDGPSFSSSNLRDIELQSPAHAYANWSGNPKRKMTATKALAFGSAAHALLLGDEAFNQRHIVQPFKDYARIEEIDDVTWKPKPAKSDDPALVESGEIRYKSVWREKMLEAKKVIVTMDDLAHIKNMAEVLNGDPRLEGIMGGDVEQSCFWRDEATGLFLKSRLDVRPLGDTLVDLKTCVSASPYGCEKSIRERGYDQQFALGAEGLLIAGGHKIYAHMAVFIEKTPPYAVTPQEIGAQAIWRAAQRNRRALDTAALCLERGEWPSYPMPAEYNPPEWMERRLQEDEDSGLLPPPPAWLEELKIIHNRASQEAPDREIELS